MKIALLILPGLVLGVLGGAALGVGAGLSWIEIFKTSSFEGYSGMLVFFTFMPLGALTGGLGGALLFGAIAIRDAEIAIAKDPSRRHDGYIAGICAMQKCRLHFDRTRVFGASNIECSIQARRRR
jgi:hypothetical protein